MEVKMKMKFAGTLAGFALLSLVACSGDDAVRVTDEGTTEETNAAVFDMWNGDLGDYRIETGHDNGSDMSGYWFVFADDADGGASRISYPVEPGNEYSDGGLDAVIDVCGGLCGTASLDAGAQTTLPFVGLGFNVAGGNGESADVSDWGGVCVAYTAQAEMSIEMGLDDATNVAQNFDLPKVTLPIATERTEKCFAWSEFKQNVSNEFPGEVAATQLVRLRFMMRGVSGTEAKFNIIAVGTYAAYMKKVPKSDVKSSSSVIVESSASVSPNGNVLWNFFTSVEYVVQTGHDNGSGTSGYWFTYDDSEEGGKSTFEFSGTGDELGECKGLCGTATLNQGTQQGIPYAGVGFPVAGTNEKNVLDVADISDWGGLCVVYTSETTLSVKLEMDEQTNKELGSNLPAVNLPMATQRDVRCVEWKDFKQAGEGSISGEDAAKKVGAILFEISGTSITKAEIGIVGIGTLATRGTLLADVEKAMPNSSSSEIAFDSVLVFDMWNPADYEYRIETGIDDGSETSGYWYVFDDTYDGGASSIIYPITWADDDFSYSQFDALIDYCQGFCGTVKFDKGSLEYDPFAGAGFNVAGEESVGDVSSWGGVCFAYKSDKPFVVEMSLDDKVNRDLAYDRPRVQVDASTKETALCFEWKNFKQAKGNAISGEEAAKQLKSILFRFNGKDGETGEFNIKGFGSYKGGVTKQGVPVSISSSSVWTSPSSSSVTLPSSSSSVTQPSPYKPSILDFDMWNAKEQIYQIETGLDFGEANSGYWYAYGDSINGGKSTLTYPAPIGNEYDDEALDNVIDYCYGICGTIKLEQEKENFEPFYSIAFDVAGKNENGTLEAGDATSWEGFCFAYESDLEFSVELGIETEKSVPMNLELDVPSVHLEAVSSENTRCFKWEEFKQEWSDTISGEDAAKQLVSVRFRFTGKSGTSGKFNIKGVGTYRKMAPVVFVN